MRNKVSQEQVDNIFNNSECEVYHSFDKTVVASCKLPNGFVIVESSSCVDPVNFDETIGMNICTDRIKNKIWELEGYKLQAELHNPKQPDPKISV